MQNKKKQFSNKVNKKVSTTIESQFRDQKLEKQIVSYLVQKQPIAASIISPDWFSCKPLAKIVFLLKTLKVTMTQETLLYQLKASKIVNADNEVLFGVYITELFKEDVTALNAKNALLLFEQLQAFAASRDCLEGIKSILSNLREFDLTAAKAKFRQLSKPMDRIDPEGAGDYLEDFERRIEIVQERIEKAASEEMIGIPTGISRLDYMIGGVAQKEFGIIAAAPSVGKTAALINFGIHAWLQGKNIFFASGEMGKHDIQFRVDSNVAKISALKFRTGSIKSEDVERWHQQIESLRGMQDSFYEVVTFPRGFTCDHVEAEMLRVQEKHNKEIDLLLLDYMNIMQANQASLGRSDRDWKNQADAVWDFKELIATFNGGIAGWSAGQITDTYIGASELSLDALKYARAISEAAPIVIGLLRDEDDDLFNIMRVQILKLRNAAPSQRFIKLCPNLDTMTLHREVVSRKSLVDLEEDSDNEEQAKADKRRRRRRNVAY